MVICRSLVLLVAMVTVLLEATEGDEITCYSCNGPSGVSISYTPGVSPPFQSCGLPFYDNETNIYSKLPTVRCNGVCVTQAVYSLGQTRIFRSCSNVPITRGCEYWRTDTNAQQWSCISTCNTDKCNTGSDGTMVTASAAVQLLVLATTAIAGRRVFN